MTGGRLADVVPRYGFAYLTTVANARAHVGVVHPRLAGGALRVGDAGATSRRNAAANPAVTLVWPPARPGGYSLIVDGVADLDGAELIVTPGRSVLHRPAVQTAPPGPGGCAADCVELSAQ